MRLARAGGTPLHTNTEDRRAKGKGGGIRKNIALAREGTRVSIRRRVLDTSVVETLHLQPWCRSAVGGCCGLALT